jgi:enoyl-CoA hydratase/carnithine racemase
MEVPLGIIPGSCGTQTLPTIMGRNRAMEMIMSGDDIDAVTAERWGYFNRIFEASDINSYVEKLSKRVASFPVDAVRLAKQSINSAEVLSQDAMLDEAYLMGRALKTPEAQKNMRLFIECGGQSREQELRMGALCAELNKS